MRNIFWVLVPSSSPLQLWQMGDDSNDRRKQWRFFSSEKHAASAFDATSVMGHERRRARNTKPSTAIVNTATTTMMIQNPLEC